MVRLYQANVIGLRPYTFKNEKGEDISGNSVYFAIPIPEGQGFGSITGSCSVGGKAFLSHPFGVGDVISVARTSEKYEFVQGVVNNGGF